MEKAELISQTKIAFDFIQKLYFEVSYLIKEVEGLLAEETEEFIFGRGSGYAITARSSNGLDSNLVNYWMYKKLSAYFIPKEMTKLEKGQTITRFEDNPKLLYMRIVLDDKDLSEPFIHYGMFKDFKKNNNNKWPEKIEHVIGNFEYNEAKIFTNNKIVIFEESRFSFKGKLARVNLYDINSSEDISKKLIEPALKIFRGE